MFNVCVCYCQPWCSLLKIKVDLINLIDCSLCEDVSVYLLSLSCVQIYFYQNVRCREEMYNKDIVLLQVSRGHNIELERTLGIGTLLSRIIDCAGTSY